MNNAVLIMLFVAVLVAVAVAVIVALTRKGQAPLNKDEYRAKWLKIEQSVTKDEHSWHMAVLNADKLLDHAMRARHIKGQTMGERMKNAKDKFSDRNGVWTAHKLRNQIAHEPDVKLNLAQTRQALKAFRTALRDMGAL